MTQGRGERIYRACIRCRQRKVKCDLKSIGETGKPPCVKCYNEGYSCTLADSRRGGDYSHHRSRRRNRAAPPLSATWQIGNTSSRLATAKRVKNSSGSADAGGIQNPLEALELLAKVASKESNDAGGDDSEIGEVFDDRRAEHNVQDCVDVANLAQSQGLPALSPSRLELLDPRAISLLLESYQDTYHAFLPIAPRHVLNTRNIAQTAREEPFILTAVLLIATKDRPEYSEIHNQLWESMEKMILRIVLGAMEVRTVGCVEGLLILAEWVPHVSATTTPMNVSQKGNGGFAGTEDTSAWTLVGLAVRQAYLLRLDKYAFRGEVPEERNDALHRKRLAWTYTYIADRQISIRMGQAFWCRGPSLSTKFTASDFPSLQPHNSYEDDYASVLQSQLELTVLYGNIHDLLYASKSRSISIMIAGDYTKYLDDSTQGLAAWKQAWAHLEVGQHLKVILDLKYEYLRLYIHGFAFQAAISRAPGTPPNHNTSDARPYSRFPNGVLATPDGRHIHLAISAAKGVLSILGEQVNPTRHLRFLGPRFYLYAIHCAVFLYKAGSHGALEHGEKGKCQAIVQRYIENLDIAASCEQHIAAHHAALLSRLWLGKRTASTATTFSSHTISNNPGMVTTQPMPILQNPPIPFSFTDPDLLGTSYAAREPKGPDSFVTGLYDIDQQGVDLDAFSVMDFGAYGEPDLRNLLSL